MNPNYYTEYEFIMNHLCAMLLMALMPSFTFVQSSAPETTPVISNETVAVVIIVKANLKNPINTWLHNRLGTTGDNLNVELIPLNYANNVPPTHFGGICDELSVENRDLLVNTIGRNPNIWVFSNVDFWDAIGSLGLRPIPQPF